MDINEERSRYKQKYEARDANASKLFAFTTERTVSHFASVLLALFLNLLRTEPFTNTTMDLKKADCKEKFEEIFARLVASGLSRPQAAAQSLVELKEVLSRANSVNDESEPANILTISNMMNHANENKDYTPIIHLIGKVFSSPESIIHAFTKPVLESNMNDSNDNTILSIQDIKYIYNILLSSNIERIRSSLVNALELLTSNLLTFSSPISDYKSLNIYMIILEHPESFDPRYDILLKYLFQVIDKSSKNNKLNFKNWLVKIGVETYKKYLSIIIHHITIRIYQGAVDDARTAVRILSILHSISSSSTYNMIPIQDFYIDALNQDYMSTRDGRGLEFKLWHDDRRQQQLLSQRIDPLQRHISNSFISYPFVLCPAIKATILEMDSQYQMRQEIDQEMFHALSHGQQYMMPYLVLRIRRQEILADTLSQMMFFEEKDFKKPLKVVFDNEEGVDAGGVRKEYYQVMMKKMLDPNFGMFKYYEESRQLWFNSDCLETVQEFELVGILLGIAIYNSIIIDLPMPF
eukprot:gene10022-20866_t